MPIAFRLALRQWLARPLRPILCSIAIAAAVALIICVGAAMDSLRYTISTVIGQALGVAEVHLRPVQKETDARLPQELLDRIRSLPEVEMASGRLHSLAILTHDDDRRYFDVLGVETDIDKKLRPLNYSAGGPPGKPDEMAVDESIAQVLHLKLGDRVKFAEKDNLTEKESSPRLMMLVGIVQRPTIELVAKPTIFVPIGTLAADMGIAPAYNVIDMKLKDSAGITDYDRYAAELGKKLGPSVDVTPATTHKAKLSELTRSLHMLLLVVSTMAAFCAALIIGTTLAVGVQERIRQFGQLRCIGASRAQLAWFLLADATVMLVFGETLGVLLGMGLSTLLVAWFPQYFLGYDISLVSLLVALLCGAAATLGGAAIPIWQIRRISPMAAVQSVAQPPRRAHVRRAAWIGAASLLMQAGLWVLIPSRDWRFYTYVALGIPLIFGGWCLLAPVALVAAERFASGFFARLLGVRPALLRNAWSRTPWRSGAMIAALMIGVTIFTAVRGRGESILASWTSPAHIPDIIIKSFASLNDKRIEALRRRYPEFGDITLMDYFGVRMQKSVFKLGALFGEGDTTFIAVEPKAFSRMIELEYIQGNPATAIRQLEEGGHIFVSKEFYNIRKLGVGDKMTFRDAEGKPVSFTIAAVVSSTGSEMIKNFFDLRQGFSEQSASSVVGSIADARRYFKMGDPTIMLVDIKPEYSDPPQVRDLMKRLFSSESGLNAISSLDLKVALADMVRRMMNGMSVIAFGALCVASLGVANMVIASVHAKRFEFGVLRAIGAGRWQLVRMVLAEVTLIGVVAGVLGALAGLHFAYMATRIDKLLIGFATDFLALTPGPAILMALAFIGVAILMTTVLAWLASLGPAIRGATSAQRTLLAGGRA